MPKLGANPRTVAIAAVASTALAATAPQDDLQSTYTETVRPILERYCFECHGPSEQKAGVRIDDLDPDFVEGIDAEEWHFALDMIEGAEMPPAKAEQWTDEERRAVTRWIRDSLEEAKRANEGEVRPVLRRLTRRQYSNTLRDLLGIGVRYGDALPPDEKSKHGFTNNGATLHASPLHLDTYQAIAREALDEAIVTGDRPEVVRYRVRFGRGLGKGHVGARVGGYQSVPLSSDDFVIDVLDENGEPVAVNDDDDARRRKIGVGLRGSSRSRFRTNEDGLVLYGAVPHREKAPGAWQGPSPNAKLELQRVFPETGEVVMRVRASRGEMWRTREPVLVPLEDAVPACSYDEAKGTVETSADAVVRTALVSDQRQNLSNAGDALVPDDLTMPSNSRVHVNVPREGFWQVDLVHPPRGADAMPTIRLSRAKQTLDVRPETPEADLARERVVTTIGAAYLPKGGQHLKLGGPFFTGYSHVVLTPLAADHPLMADLDAHIDGEEERFAGADPVLRVFAGTRTDDGMDYRTFDGPRVVDGSVGETNEYVFRERLENLPIPEPESGDTEILSGYLLLGLWNDYLVKDRRSAGPPLLVESIEIEAPYHESWPPPSHRAIFFESDASSEEDVYAREVIERFLGRAFRRDALEETVDRYHEFWRATRGEFATFEDSIREVLVAALTSPRFLYLVEPEAPDGDTAPALDDHALAARLSYFLWDSCPDDELMRLADSGELRANVGDVALRMLDDPRSLRFVEVFAEEWLRLDRLEQMTVDVGRFPDFTRFVKRDMREETVRFLHHVFTADLTVRELIDSDFALLNQNLAEFYGVEDVAGPHFRVVPVVRELGRGGLLSQGAFLTGHSDGVQPHPIKRAVWLKEKILGDPPPPPPPNVPDLDPEAPGFAKLTLKEQLEKHRDSASCRDCHAGIDPFGIAFERYGATGKWSEERNGKVVDALTTLPDGTAVDGVGEMKRWLLERSLDQVTRSFVEHLFGYALGRDVSYADEELLERVLENVRRDGYRLSSVVREICESDAFTR